MHVQQGEAAFARCERMPRARGQAQEHPRFKRMRDAIQPSGAGSGKDEIRLLGNLVVAGGGHRSRVEADMPGSQGTLLVTADQRFQMVGAKGAVGREFPRLPANGAFSAMFYSPRLGREPPRLDRDKPEGYDLSVKIPKRETLVL